VGYIHVFSAGVVSARIFMLTCMRDSETAGRPTASTQKLALASKGAPVFFAYGCVLGYGLYTVLVLLLDMSQGDDWYVFFHNGGLLPIMILIIIGGALGLDPLARYVFQSQLFLLLGRISYAQYLAQYLVFKTSLLGRIEDLTTRQIVFPCVLLPFAYFIERFVARIYTEWQRARQARGERGCDEQAIAAIDKWMGKCWNGLCVGRDLKAGLDQLP
jgi:peptidoglycan/LPS O-acetylase OafA/YrhL